MNDRTKPPPPGKWPYDRRAEAPAIDGEAPEEVAPKSLPRPGRMPERRRLSSEGRAVVASDRPPSAEDWTRFRQEIIAIEAQKSQNDLRQDAEFAKELSRRAAVEKKLSEDIESISKSPKWIAGLIAALEIVRSIVTIELDSRRNAQQVPQQTTTQVQK